MQISRHWRLNATRYRLQGCAYADGTKSLQQRPVSVQDASMEAEESEMAAKEQSEKSPVAAA